MSGLGVAIRLLHGSSLLMTCLLVLLLMMRTTLGSCSHLFSLLLGALLSNLGSDTCGALIVFSLSFVVVSVFLLFES